MNNEKNNSTLQPKIYHSKSNNIKGNIFYFHGGGLLFGTKYDLPKYHIESITEAGYNILAFNYPLAPESKFQTISEHVLNSINSYAESIDGPYFLWGRSAGAYLCLMSISKGLNIKPKGVISYYGYGFLTPDWHNTPSNYYLKYPLVEFKDVKYLIEDEPLLSSPVNPRFLLYLYTRQTGKWWNFISDNNEDDFLKDFSLRDVDLSNYPPVFLAHNTKDNDVPYEESIQLANKIKNVKLFTCTTGDHDFDRNTDSPDTIKLIKETIEFLNECIILE